MNNFELNNIDPLDINDLIEKIEKSFEVTIENNEGVKIKTLGDLCDIVTNKIQLENSLDCTSQQAFYKIRDGISQIKNIDKSILTTNYKLSNLFHKDTRKKDVNKLEEYLGINLNILRPYHWLTFMFVGIFLSSIICLFIYWKVGLIGIIFTYFGFYFSEKYGNELDLETLGELAAKMTREHYVKSRRNSNTYNKNEIEKLIIDWFSTEFLLEKSKLTREAKFV